MKFFKFDDLHQQSLIVLGMVHAQIKEHVMMQQEPVFVSKGLKDSQAHAKVTSFISRPKKSNIKNHFLILADKSCPGSPFPCNYNGQCDHTTGQCICNEGHQGFDCSGNSKYLF